jgi:hypothetical protein
MPVTVLQDGADGLDGQGLDAGEDLGLGGLEDAVEASERDERQDDSAILGLLVVAAQQIGDGPDEAGVVVGRGVVCDEPELLAPGRYSGGQRLFVLVDRLTVGAE